MIDYFFWNLNYVDTYYNFPKEDISKQAVVIVK